MKLSDFFESRYVVKRLRGKSEKTIRLHRIAMQHFDRSLGRPAKLTDLEDYNIEKMMLRLSQLGRAPATINGNVSKICSVWRYAKDCNLVSNKPDVTLEKEPDRVPTAWLVEDIQKLLTTARKMPGDFSGVPCGLWWEAMIRLCMDTGERIGAVRQARWEWMEGNWILFPAEVRKGQKRDRRFMLSLETCGLLMRIRTYSPPTIFPWPYHELYIWKRYKKLLTAAGLPHDRRDCFHRIRRTTASVVHAAGLDASEAMDHSQRSTTRRYLDPRFTREIQPAQALADYLANPGIRSQQQPPQIRIG